MDDVTILTHPANAEYVSIYTNNRTLASALAEGDEYLLEDSEDYELYHDMEFEVKARYRVVLHVGTVAFGHR